MLYLSWSLSSIIAPDAELSDITRVVVVVLPKTWKQTKSWSTFPFKDSSERTTAGITVEVAKWCFLWSVIFFSECSQKTKRLHIFIDLCPVEHSGNASTSLKAESSLHVSKQSCCAGRKDVPVRLLVSIRLRCAALIQTLWFSGWEDVSCAPVKGSLPPSLKKEKCFVTRGEQLAQVLPLFDVDTPTGGNPPTCIHLTYWELS